MVRAKGKANKGGAALIKAIKTGSVKGPTMSNAELNTACLDFRSAAAVSEFTLDDKGLDGGKKAGTKEGVKTVFAGESWINVEHRIRAAAIPLGRDLGDDAFVAEALSIQGFRSVQPAQARALMPRRPAWTFDTSSGRLHHREATVFKQWLEDIRALIADRGGYPPAFEQNLQVWRQLWRVLERCDVAVLVVDARHPLLHLPPALVYHVTRTLRKPLVVVLNKLDTVEPKAAQRWAEVLRSAIPGVSGVVGYSREHEVLAKDFGALKVGRQALIDECQRVHADAEERCERGEARPPRAGDEEPETEVEVEVAMAPEVKEGAVVEVLGLKSLPELNGCRGVLQHFDDAAGRWQVDIEGAGPKKLKPENFRLAAGGSAAAAGAGAEAAAAARDEEASGREFVAAAKFTGSLRGFVFKLGEAGLGYYRDAAGATVTTSAPMATQTQAHAAARAQAAADARQAMQRREGVEVGRVMIGLVGHPNVGKSSLVNNIMGGKVVSVKATPGHTKTLQTLVLDDRTCLCDSPGVVFPRLEVPREAQIVGMLIPLAQVREPFSALRWCMEHALQPVHELLNLKPPTLQQVLELKESGIDALTLDSAEDSGELPWSPMLLCVQYANQRGLTKRGGPDYLKAGMEILERVLDGRIPYACHPPTRQEVDAALAGELAEESEAESEYGVDDMDAEYESEPEDAVYKDHVARGDLFGVFGEDRAEPGSGSIKSRKRQDKQKAKMETKEVEDGLPTATPAAGKKPQQRRV